MSYLVRSLGSKEDIQSYRYCDYLEEIKELGFYEHDVNIFRIKTKIPLTENDTKYLKAYLPDWGVEKIVFKSDDTFDIEIPVYYAIELKFGETIDVDKEFPIVEFNGVFYEDTEDLDHDFAKMISGIIGTEYF